MARPKVLDDVKRKMVSLPAELAQAVEDYRFANRLKTEAEAIRRLIEAGLGARGTRGGPRPGSSGPGGARKPGSTGKTTAPRARKAPAPKAAPLVSKEAQIRALREQSAN